jgi:hypothetical protein
VVPSTDEPTHGNEERLHSSSASVAIPWFDNFYMLARYLTYLELLSSGVNTSNLLGTVLGKVANV